MSAAVVHANLPTGHAAALRPLPRILLARHDRPDRSQEPFVNASSVCNRRPEPGDDTVRLRAGYYLHLVSGTSGAEGIPESQGIRRERGRGLVEITQFVC